jgi:putative transposase
VLDWYTKTIIGYAAGMQCKAQDWLMAPDMAVNRQLPADVRGQGLSLMSDNGCNPRRQVLCGPAEPWEFNKCLPVI